MAMSDLFAWAKLVGTPQDGLALQTRRRSSIENTVGLPDVVWGQQRWFEDMASKYGWSIRSRLLKKSLSSPIVVRTVESTRS
jgi:hypothetical protein